MKIKKLRELSNQELQNRLNELREENRTLRFRFAFEKTLENPKKIRDNKKDIARIQTLLNERLRGKEVTK